MLVVTDPRTPTKWINYIGTLDFGGFADQTGGLNLCKKDPANNRVTGYRIDAPQNAPRGNTLYARTTAPDGTITFDGLAAGPYRIIFVSVNGITLDDNEQRVELAKAQQMTGLRFAETARNCAWPNPRVAPAWPALWLCPCPS